MNEPSPPAHDLPANILEVEDGGGRPGLQLSGPAGTARVTLLGAHVTSWQPPDVEEVMFTSRDASFAPGVATRGGVPVVLPWFGPWSGAGTSAAHPAHGFGRTREWQLIAYSAAPSITLELRATSETRAQWPHSFRATMTVSLERGLAIALRMENLSDHPFTFEEALHTYFRVGDVRQASVHGLESVAYAEFAKSPAEDVAPNLPIDFRAETDRVFTDPPDHLELHAPALGRRIALDARGSASTVVWNPWIAKAAAMGQMADDEWTEFVCVETANCKDRAVTLEPGQAHEMGLRLTLM